MEYDKSQYGVIINVLFGLMLFVFLYIYLFQRGDHLIPITPFIVILSILLFVIGMFYKLRIKVNNTGISIIYGIGLIHIKINPEKLDSVTIVKNPWYYGLGIRFTPKGMLYNINGRDAIELTYIQNGKKKNVRIGSNDCENLQQIIKAIYGVK